jgi:hypothetical protein
VFVFLLCLFSCTSTKLIGGAHNLSIQVERIGNGGARSQRATERRRREGNLALGFEKARIFHYLLTASVVTGADFIGSTRTEKEKER